MSSDVYTMDQHLRVRRAFGMDGPLPSSWADIYEMAFSTYSVELMTSPKVMAIILDLEAALGLTAAFSKPKQADPAILDGIRQGVFNNLKAVLDNENAIINAKYGIGVAAPTTTTEKPDFNISLSASLAGWLHARGLSHSLARTIVVVLLTMLGMVVLWEVLASGSANSLSLKEAFSSKS